MEDFPRDLKNAIRKINSGQISVNLNHQGIDPMVHTINRVTKQVVAAVLVTGLLVGSILLITNEIGPKWDGYSAFGVTGVFLSLIIVLRITSYNVCYTKLLRGDLRGAWKIVFNH